MISDFDPSLVVTALPFAAASAVAFRSEGTLKLTVVAKATFAFAPDADMTLVEPLDVVRAEAHHGGSPARSVRFTSELAPFLPRADVLFSGFAHCPAPSPGQPPPHAFAVRLAIFTREKAILDKTLVVNDASDLERIPVVYERARGGTGFPDNPVGTAQPSIFSPSDPGQAAGFGPISRAWPARRRLLGRTPRKAVEAPVAEIPDGFDGSYFQAAPPDQRIDFLRGDEWILTEGLHPSHLFRTRLPDVRARGRVHGLSASGIAEGREIDLQADMLHIDGEAELCTLVFRQTLPLESAAALSAARVVVGVELHGIPIVWPAAAELSARFSSVGPKPIARAPEPGATLMAGDPGPAPAALPFQAVPAPGVLSTSQSSGPAPRMSTGTFAVFGESAAPPVERPVLSSAEPPSPWAAGAPAELSAPAAPLFVPIALPLSPPEDPALPAAPAASPEPEVRASVLDLLFHERKCLPRVRRHPSWAPILAALQDKPHDPDIDAPDLAESPVEGEERREIFEILAHGEAQDGDALWTALKGAVRDDGRFVAPLVLLQGELSIKLDPEAHLRAALAAFGPHASTSDALQKALELAGQALSEPDMHPASTFVALHARLEEAYGQTKRAVPLASLKARIARASIERRRYLRRTLLGAPHVAALFVPRGATEAIPTYLPEAAAPALPMSQLFSARLIAEAHLSQDDEETHGAALRIVALARSSQVPERS